MTRFKKRQLLFTGVVTAAVLIVSIAAVIPFYFSRTQRAPGTNEPVSMLRTDDMPNHLAYSKEFDKGLRAGSIYPRWMADINKGYGVATMIYYPPGFFYLSSFVHIAVKDWFNTFFLISALGLAASFLSFYWLARKFLGRLPSVVGASLYMLLPFHLFNLYYQGAMPQFLGYVFMPLVLYCAFRLGERGQARYYAALGLIHGLYLLTHLPVSYLFTYVLASYAVVWALKARDIRIAVRIAGGMTLSLLVSAVYWLPAAVETKFAYEWASELMPYHTTYLTLLESQSTFGLIVNLSFVLIVALLVLSMWVLRTATRESASLRLHAGDFSAQTDVQIRLWTFLGLLTTFMSTSFSIYVSKLIPRIGVATPAWRWLCIAGLFGSLLVGAAVERLATDLSLSSRRRLLYSAAIGVTLALNLWITVRYAVIEAVRSSPTLTLGKQHLDFGFTPMNATPPDRLPETPLVMIQPENGVIEVEAWRPQHRALAVRLDQPSEVRLKTYNFPGWTARIDGQIVPLSSDKDGAQVISVPSGIHKIEVDFVDTPPRTFGAVFFGLGLFTIVALIGLDYMQRKPLRTIEIKGGATGDAAAREALDTGLKDDPRPRPKAVLVTIVVVAIAIGAVIVAGRFGSGSESSSVTKGNTGSEETRSRTSGGVGSEARLYLKGPTSVPVAVDPKAMEELTNALSAKSNDGMELLIQSGRVFLADNNTKVRILEIGSGKLKVRILEGPHVTMDGWVPERWVR